MLADEVEVSNLGLVIRNCLSIHKSSTYKFANNREDVEEEEEEEKGPSRRFFSMLDCEPFPSCLNEITKSP